MQCTFIFEEPGAGHIPAGTYFRFTEILRTPRSLEVVLQTVVAEGQPSQRARLLISGASAIPSIITLPPKTVTVAEVQQCLGSGAYIVSLPATP